MPRSAHLGWQRAIIIQASVFVGIMSIAALYWARVVFVPVALGIFLTFLLAPVVSRLQRYGLGRTTAVVTAVSITGVILGLLTWTTTAQVLNLATDLPSHTEKIKTKVDLIQNAGKGGILERLQIMLNDIQGGKTTIADTDSTANVGEKATEPEWISKAPDQIAGFLQSQVGGLLDQLGTIALAVILAVFMLLSREDLRNRILKLVGNSRISTTTRAFDEAGDRVSRYLLMQLIVNGTYGLAWGLGLFLIGVDYALLWGFLAATLRYIPYLGGPIAAVLPVMLSLIIFEGWTRPIVTIAYLILLELISNNVMEPWLYGKSMGVSAVAQLVAATFWGFLWGPIGLVLSSPLTVCLLVLGRHVPKLNFVTVLLGDEPALSPSDAFYQRLMAKDESEALHIASPYAETTSRFTLFDDVIVPALVTARRDFERGTLDRTEVTSIFAATDRIIAQLAVTNSGAAPSPSAPTTAERSSSSTPTTGSETTDMEVGPTALLCAAHDDAEETYIRMLQQNLSESGFVGELISSKYLPSEIETHVRLTRSAVVVIAILPPGGVEQAKYLCKRLRTAFPDLKIIVMFGGLLRRKFDKLLVRMRAAGATALVTSLAQARDQVILYTPPADIGASRSPSDVESAVIHAATP